MSISGTSANDIVVGGIEDDELLGRAGDDVLRGKAGDDELRGGSGNDQLFGGSGSDNLFGGVGDDVLDGGTGGDTLRGGAGNDRLTGGTGNDRAVFSGARADYVITRIDDTHILISDTRLNGDGSDTLSIDIEQVRFADGIFTLAELTPPIGPTDGDDMIEGTGDPDTIDALGGNDVIKGGAGNDTIDGGEGFDTVVLAGSRGDYQVMYHGAFFQTYDEISTETDTLYNVEALQFGDGTVFTLADLKPQTGTAGDDTMSGTGWYDELTGLAGNDTLIGGGGNDSLFGGDGIDTAVLTGNRADYDIVHAEGTTFSVLDLRVGSPDGWKSLFDVEVLLFADGSTLELASLIPPLVVEGTDGDDMLAGTDGDDVIDSLAGFDTVYTGAGDDTIHVGPGGERVHGGDGVDTAVFAGSRADYDIYQFQGPGPEYGFPDDPVIIGVYGRGDGLWMDSAGIEFFQFADGTFNLEDLTRDLDNTFTGTEAADVLDLGAGDDRVFALGGDDTIITGPGFERIDGGDGVDTVVLSGNRTDYDVFHFTVGPFNDIFASHDDVVGIYAGTGGAYVETADVELFQFADGTFSLAQLIASQGSADMIF